MSLTVDNVVNELFPTQTESEKNDSKNIISFLIGFVLSHPTSESVMMPQVSNLETGFGTRRQITLLTNTPPAEARIIRNITTPIINSMAGTMWQPGPRRYF